jgi:hypothetical protein
MTRRACPAATRAPRVALPWLVYVAVNVAAPAANGAWRDAGFAGHALLTVGVSGGLLLAWLGLARLVRRLTRRAPPPCSAAP